MSLLIAFVAWVLVGQAISVVFGLIVEHFTSAETSLLAFIPLYFAVFGVAWKVSVRMTEPSTPEVTDAGTTAGPQAAEADAPHRSDAAASPLERESR
jgi:hypothetical protein